MSILKIVSYSPFYTNQDTVLQTQKYCATSVPSSHKMFLERKTEIYKTNFQMYFFFNLCFWFVHIDMMN